MKIYVASSWRNQFHQQRVVAVLRAWDHEVYDFTDSEGFRWSDIATDYVDWATSIPTFIRALGHPLTERGFDRDMTALREADACAYVTPCGVSASLEAGYAKGAGKLLLVYVPALKEPDLMLKMADLVTDELEEVVRYLIRHELLPKDGL